MSFKNANRQTYRQTDKLLVRQSDVQNEQTGNDRKTNKLSYRQVDRQVDRLTNEQ